MIIRKKLFQQLEKKLILLADFRTLVKVGKKINFYKIIMLVDKLKIKEENCRYLKELPQVSQNISFINLAILIN